jgi:hypothetical protein
MKLQKLQPCLAEVVRRLAADSIMQQLITLGYQPRTCSSSCRRQQRHFLPSSTICKLQTHLLMVLILGKIAGIANAVQPELRLLDRVVAVLQAAQQQLLAAGRMLTSFAAKMASRMPATTQPAALMAPQRRSWWVAAVSVPVTSLRDTAGGPASVGDGAITSLCARRRLQLQRQQPFHQELQQPAAAAMRHGVARPPAESGSRAAD